MFDLHKNKNGSLRRALAALCALLLCVSTLCACGKDKQGNDDNTGAASSSQSASAQGSSKDGSEQPVVTDIYELPLFDEMPETYAEITPAFWKAESANGGVLYLLGAIHVGDKSAYRMPQKIMDAYLESDALACELDLIALKEDEEKMESLKALTSYPDGDSLKNHLDPLMYEEIVEFLKAYSDDSDVISKLANRRPCIWLSELGAIDDAASGLSPDYGIDEHFTKLAHAQGKEILEIETAEEQYNALNSIPDLAYEYLLGMYIQSPDTLGNDVRQLFEQWKAGTIKPSTDPDAEAAAVEDDPFGYTAALAEYNRVIFTDRNVTMANAAKSYLDDGRKVFLTVGSEHMLGSTGIIASLEADGYTVSRIEL